MLKLQDKIWDSSFKLMISFTENSRFYSFGSISTDYTCFFFFFSAMYIDVFNALIKFDLKHFVYHVPKHRYLSISCNEIILLFSSCLILILCILCVKLLKRIWKCHTFNTFIFTSCRIRHTIQFTPKGLCWIKSLKYLVREVIMEMFYPHCNRVGWCI